MMDGQAAMGPGFLLRRIEVLLANRRYGTLALLTILPLGLALGAGGWTLAAHGAPSEAEEEANCARVAQVTEENSAPVLQALERLAQRPRAPVVEEARAWPVPEPAQRRRACAMRRPTSR